MARDLHFEHAPMKHVAGMEWARHCVNFHAKIA